jgi:hypothetical protein
VLKIELFPLVESAPPAPIVTVYVVAIGTKIALSAEAPPPEVAPETFVLNPPAPPPPALLELIGLIFDASTLPPPPPPAITRYSTGTGAAPPDAAKIPKGISIS